MSEVRGQRWFSEYAHLKTSWIQHQMNQKDGILAYPPHFPLSSSPPFAVSDNFHRDSSPSTSSSGTRICPAVLFIIVILAVLFFVSGLLHLLVRFLIKHPSSSASSQSHQYPEVSNSEALQRQLQQLFHLHDSGLDQAFIDALPVFVYKEIVGAWFDKIWTGDFGDSSRNQRCEQRRMRQLEESTVFKEMNVDYILDPKLRQSSDTRAHMELVNRMVKTAMRCVQDSADDRPSMGKVAKMLEGTVEITEPKRPTTFYLGMDGGMPL